jgi:hypothetical protein
MGGIVEEFIEAPEKASPSTQMRISPTGEVLPISTHDQLLGGPSGQVFLGCVFPADTSYRMRMQEEALKIGKVLASHGVVSRFGVDFLVWRHDPGAEWKMAALEINLRMGGTSHPFFMARFVTDGSYDPADGNLIADGRAKHYVANDNLKSPAYVGLKPAEVIDAMRRAGLAFDTTRKTGVTLHMMGALTGYGKVGGLAIGDSPDEADALYLALVETLDALGA